MPRGVYPHLHMVPKVYPDALVAAVGSLYAGGLTQREVAKELGVSQKVVFTLMRNHGIPTRTARPRATQAGPNNYNWKGEAAGYQAKHVRVYVRKGRASEHPCVE